MWPQISAWTWWSFAAVIFIVMSSWLYRNEILLAGRHTLAKISIVPRSRRWFSLVFGVAGLTLLLTIFWPDTGPGLKMTEKEKDLFCDLTDNLRRIDWAVNEQNVEHFEQELRRLYPSLERCGLKVPLVDPVSISHRIYDNTWYEFHLTFLKALRRSVRNDEFDLYQWNADVDRENAKRKRVVQEHVN